MSCQVVVDADHVMLLAGQLLNHLSQKSRSFKCMGTAYSVTSFQVQASAACQAILCCQQILAVLTAMQQMQEQCTILQTVPFGMLLSNRPEPALRMTEAMLGMLKGHDGECTAEQHRSLEHAGATAILGC